jgi:hypothetical protein
MMSSGHFAAELVRQHIQALAEEAGGRSTPARAQAPLAPGRTSPTFAAAAVLRRLADRLDPPCIETAPLASGSRRPSR